MPGPFLVASLALPFKYQQGQRAPRQPGASHHPLAKNWGKRQGIWGQQVHTATFKMDNQQGPTIYTMNSPQSYVAAWMGEEFGGGWICVYVWLSPFGVHLELSQHC